MNTLIDAEELRAALPAASAQVRRGKLFPVGFRSRPAFHPIPLEDTAAGFEKARGLFFRYDDSGLSYTGRTGFAATRKLRLCEAFTTEHYSAQIGSTLRH